MVSEIDLRDWELSTEQIELYKVPRQTPIRMKDGALDLFFDHIDGAYSYCLYLGPVENIVKGTVIHLAAWTPVFQYKKKGT
jgi:hypothetical protein